MISVIIPLYNKKKYIAETINSVLNQTYKDFEILIINDGSTDGSLEVVNMFTDERINIYSIKNSGVSVARNIGVEKSCYNYVAFLDADDYWDKNFLSEMVYNMKQYPNEKIFTSGTSKIFRDQTLIYSNPFLPEKNKSGKIEYIKVISQFLPPINSSNSIFYKKILITAGLFKEGQRQHEDHDLWLRVCQKNLVVYINKPLSFYRKDIVGSGSQSNIRFFDFKEYLLTILETKNSIDTNRNQYFEKFYNRYILLSFIKFQSEFSNDERSSLLKIINKIISPQVFVLIKLIDLTPSGLVYNLLSKLRGKKKL